jgi:hypothetical protein
MTSSVQAQFGGFGGFGGPGGMGNNPLGLLNLPQVKKELKVTDEQMAKLPDAINKALGEVLNTDQVKRLHQIQLQLRGAQAFADPKVQKALSFTDKQTDEVKTILGDAKKEVEGLEKGPGMFKEIQRINKESNEKMMGVLTDTQKQSWKDMLGEKFELKFGPPGGKGKGEDKSAFVQPVIRPVVASVLLQKKD